MQIVIETFDRWDRSADDALMNILSINIRGLKKRRKRIWIKDMCFKHNIHFLGLQETKMTKLELFRLKSMWGNFQFDYACSMARDRSGGLISMWDPNLFVKSNIWCGDNYVIVNGKWKNSTEDYYFINVYGPQHQPEKANLCNFLRLFIQDHHGKIILFGDLNEVRDSSERYGSLFSSGDASIFNSFIQDASLLDLLMRGKMFTWMNKAGTKLSKIDCFLISEDILEVHPDIHVTILDKLWSDHNLILLHCNKIDFGQFRFVSFIRGLIVPSLMMSLKKLGQPQWYSHVKISDNSKKKDITASLNSIEALIDSGNATDDDKAQRITKLLELDNLEKLKSMDLFQKGRIKWDVEGDENSKYFQGIINSRRKHQTIQGITIDGVWITDPISIKMDFLDFFKDKFDSHDNQMNLPNFTTERSLSLSDYNYLESVISLEAIRSMVWDCVVKFFDSTMLPQGTNSAFITLIPKIPNPLFIKDYRPISLIGIQYKIIAKILANRLSKVIDSLVSQEQSAFVSGRQILDGPLILSEIIDWYKKRNKKMLLFKVNFEKAFDSKNFLKRGLRQGDPLSPFLFIIIMEGLHISLRDSMVANLIQGVKLGPSNFRLSHLLYADDVIIMSDWDQRDMENIIHVFYMASGLKININKSSLFGVGVSSEEVANMAVTSGCLSSSLPFLYLGLQIGYNMNRVASWKVLIERFNNKLSGWKSNLLSIGGRLTIIKSVLGSLGIYYMLIFKAPETIVKMLESFRASFFWGSTEDKKKLAWIKWRLLKSPEALWAKVIKSIHGTEAGMDSNGCQTNGLWAKIVGTINHLHSSDLVPLSSIKYKMGDGSLIRFWIDTWTGNLPLRDRFTRLFHLENYKECLIQDRTSNGPWSWDWIRPISLGRSLSDYTCMLDVIGPVEVGEDRDSCSWSLSNDGSFTINSLRRHLDDCLLPSLAKNTRWCKIIPRKVNIFMWRLSLDKLPRHFNLSSRGLDIQSILCPICNKQVETLNHIFFSCETTFNIWRLISTWSGSKIPILVSYGDWDSWFESWHASKDSKERALVIFATSSKDDLRNVYEKCNDISQESRALINSFLKEVSDKDYELNLSMYGNAAKLEKQMDAKLAWLLEKYYYRSQESVGCSSSQADLYLTEKELHQLHLDEEALREILEEKAMDEKAREEKISLDIDDSDLHLTPVVRSSSSTRVEPSPYTQNPVTIITGHAGIVQLSSSTRVKPSLSTLNPVRIIPGPAGLVQQARLLKEKVFILDPDGALMSTQQCMDKVVEDVGDDDDFKSLAWVSATNYANAFCGTVTGCLGDVDNFLKKEKLEQVVAIVKSCFPNMLGGLNVTMKNLSGTIPGTIHRKVIGEGGYKKDITVGAAMILANVSVFTPKPSQHYLNITMRNVVEVFRKDTVSGSGSG
ncbi:RNA-directed DNA polymerase, eukaryota [Tanacetum coccineum]|uniref:RNA-directed DNA polymerase, eukaryota n=1 Tax=Tanacetum coccineum TaxID=301880 RepID=A0ABQ5FSX3_9ASTR